MRKFKVTVNGVTYNVEVAEEGVAVAAAPAPAAAAPKAPAAEVAAGDTPVNAPMPGKVTKIVAKEGQKVKRGDVIMLLAAMKMQNEISSPVDGTVKSINVTAGQSVKPGEVMAVLS
jgi:glutaconyl-CoA decarboxylase